MHKGLRYNRISRSKATFNITLERVLGLTATNNCSVAFDSKNSRILYTAGCVIVGESCDTNKQFIIQNITRKALCCLDVSVDGKYVVTGESGHQPMVRIWSCADGHQIGELGSHHFRITAVRFSPVAAMHIVSIGCQEDHTICVWDRTLLQKIASAKVSARVFAVAFSGNGQFFITVGIRHVRFWYIDYGKCSKVKETQPLKGRNAVLGDLLHNTFTDVCCTTVEAPVTNESQDRRILTLVLSQTGRLLQINEDRYVEKWVDLRVSSAGCLAISGLTVAVGCASGVCLLFSAANLRFIDRVPLPHPLGSNGYNPGGPCLASEKEELLYAEVAAVKLDLSLGLLICMYTDHSIYCWDVAHSSSTSPRFTHLYHSRSVCCCTAVMGVRSQSVAWDETDLRRWKAVNSGAAPAHGERFLTCSDDDTVRVWSFPVDQSTIKSSELFPDGKEDVRILYSDRSYANILSDDRNSAGGFGQGSVSNSSVPSSPAPSRSEPMRSGISTSVGATPGVLSTTGFGLRALAISPDQLHLAVGDRTGQLRVYDLESFKLLHSIRAHDAGILSITYFKSKQNPEVTLLSTSSRDRVIHVFTPRQEYSRVQTLADHSGVVNSVCFVECEESGKIYLISCSADHSLLFRTLTPDPASQTARFVIDHHISVTHSYTSAVVVGPTVFNLDTPNQNAAAPPPRPRKFLAVTSQDRQVYLYQVTKPRQVFHYRASTSEDGVPACCATDPTNTIMATAGSDKQINLFHLFKGDHIATLYGHADIVMGLLFLPDLRHLISVSYDSCIFVWRLDPSLTALMLDRQNRVAAAVATLALPAPIGLNTTGDTLCPQSSATPLTSLTVHTTDLYAKPSPESEAFCLDEHVLPSWARNKCRSESDTEISKCPTVPRVQSKDSLSRQSPRAALVSKLCHVSRSNSERIRPPRLLLRCRRNGTSSSRVSGRGSSLGGLAVARKSEPRDTDEEQQQEEEDSDAMTSFPRWASSALDVTEEVPFRPPGSDSDDSEPKSLPVTASASSIYESVVGRHLSEGSHMSRSLIEDHIPKLSRVEEILYHEELETPGRGDGWSRSPRFLEPREPHNRVGWRSKLEPDHAPAVDAEHQNGDAIRVPAVGQTEGDDVCLSEEGVADSNSSASDCLSALGILTRVRDALDTAVMLISRIDDKNVISESSEFFQKELEWRLSDLRALLHVDAPSAPACAADALHHLASKDLSKATVADFIERLIPTIQSALAETLISENDLTNGRGTSSTVCALEQPSELPLTNFK